MTHTPNPRPVALAFDRGTVRRIDMDGRLHVEVTNISKANVCPYMGREIPDSEALGLNPDQVYQLFRDPEELRKGAATFNNIPLLSEHVPVSAADHRPDLVIGATGSNAEFVAPYLRNSLVVWASDAIKKIQHDEVRELSCAYRYRAVMEPGTYQGERYDGRMVALVGNHVAVVEQGRAGPDVVVGDSLPQELKHMTKKRLSATAMLAKGALLAHLKPRLAADSKFDLNPILAGVTAKNWLAQKAVILQAIKPQLAADADLDAMHKLMDSLDEPVAKDDDDTAMDEPVDKDAPAADPVADPEPEPMDPNVTVDEPDSKAEVLALLDKLRELLSPAAAADAPPAVAPVDADLVAKDGDDEDDADKKEKPMPFTKAAMDSAISKAVKDAEAKTVARMRGAAEAEEVIKPYVGKLALSFDSAEGVYKAALETLSVNVKGLHPSAFRAVLEAQPKPANGPRLIASDASLKAASVAEQFPGLAALRVI